MSSVNYPVVRVELVNFEAYARWAVKHLPTDAEHEYATGVGATPGFA